MSSYRRMLQLGGYLSIAIGLAHVALFAAMLVAIDQLNTVMGALGAHVNPPAGGWWGWGKLLLMIIGVVGFVTTLGLYGLSGAGRIRRMPLLRTGLVGTAALYVGLLAFHAREVLANVAATAAGARLRPLAIVLPLWALALGLSYSVGTIGLWSELAPYKGGALDRGVIFDREPQRGD